MENKSLTNDEIDISYTLLEGREKIVIVDIGAADLSHSVRFRQKFGWDIKIYAMEPDLHYQPANISHSKAFHIEYSPCLMVGDDRKEVRFYPSVSYERVATGLWSGSGSIYKPNQEVIDKLYPTLTFDEVGYEICSYSWDAFVETNKIEKVDYLHIDAQGAEYEILKAATKALPDFIFAEISDFETYHTGVKLVDFDYMMFQKGYVLIATDEANALYLKAQKMI